ncbi:Ig-like domain-containing protein, partial [Roseovarius aestuarii]|nr:Ig-like domain-containing protein [Roseovarius aestuarii]
APANTAPTAEAGPAQTVNSGAAVTLDGTGSSDPDTGQTLSYTWSQTGGTVVTLSDVNADKPGFTAPTRVAGSGPETLTFQLSFGDGIATDTDTVEITVNAPANTAPTADAGADVSVVSGTQVTLSGSGTDDEGTIVGYAWTRTGGSGEAGNAALSSGTAQNPTFTDSSLGFNDVAVTHIFELVVTDNAGAESQADSVTITITPPLDTTPPEITGTADVEIDTDAGLNTASLVLAASVTDNSGEAITPEFSADGTVLSSPYAFPVGATLVTVTAQDGAGNQAIPVSFTVTVKDTTAPALPVAGAPTSTPDGRAHVSGTAEPDSIVTVTFPDGSSQTVTADPSTGAFSTVSVAPQPSGGVGITVRDAAGNVSPTLPLEFAGDDVAPTIEIAALSGPTNGMYTATIKLSEASDDFTASDLTLVNAGAMLTGSGLDYIAVLTPAADGEIALSVAAATFSDAAGNPNTASNVVTASHDASAPTVNISGAPSSLASASRFAVTVTFSEAVTGFDASDMIATNAQVTGVSGSGATYAVSVIASGTGDVILSVPADSAADSAGNGNLASNTVQIADTTVEQTQGLIAGYMQTRANQLVQNQPELIPFLSGAGKGKFNLSVTRGTSTFDFASRPDYPFWASISGAWSKDADSKSAYMFGALGGHQKISETLLLGAMLQFDHLAEETGAAKVSGTGWMFGPYFAAKAENHPLYFEGRLLYGQTQNKISPFGTYQDKFDTERLLAQLKVAGELDYGATALAPFLGLSYTTDSQKSYVDSLGNTIPEQGIELGQVEFGLDFSRAIPVSGNDLELWGGISGIWSHTKGSGFASTVTPDYDGGRARVELGFNYDFFADQRLSVGTYYDGIGASSFESYGLTIGYETTF